MRENLITLKTYNKIAPKFSKLHFKPFWIKEFKYFKKIVPGKKVVDIGCGAGRDAAVFVKNGFDYLGIDASTGMLRVASKRVKKGDFKKMDYYNLSLPSKTFDGFWAAASLLHIPKNKINKVLKSLGKVLQGDGVGFISVKEKTKIDEGLLPDKRYNKLGRFFSFYKKSEFRKILKINKFEILKVMEHKELEKDRITNWLCFFVKKKEV